VAAVRVRVPRGTPGPQAAGPQAAGPQTAPRAGDGAW